MASFNVKTNIIAPLEINIPLIRADHASTSNVFRVCFEVSLSIFSTLLGYALGLDQLQKIHWIFLIVIFLAMISFLVLSSKFSKSSHVG